MARKPVHRELPPPARLRRDFGGFDDKRGKQSVLTAHLRKIARRLRRTKARPFYSMREVMTQFGLPLRTVALAYETLEHEGLLNRRRGSQTLLAGKKPTPRKHVRAIVGIPLWLHALVVSPYSRDFHIEIENRLRRHGFVADLIFFATPTCSSPDFARRLIEHNLDYVLWHTPHPHALDVLRTLQDHGVRQITVQPIDSQLGIALPGYLQDWPAAYRTLAADWSRHGIRQALVPDPVYLPSRRAKGAFARTLADHGIETQFVEGTAATLRAHVARRQAGTCGVAFLDQQGAETICNEDPLIIEELIRLCRVGFCRGPIRMPYFHNREARIDIVRFSATEIATRIAADLRATLPPGPQVLHTFQASYHPQVSFKAGAELL